MNQCNLEKQKINNIRCILTIINFALVLCFGRSFAWIGLGVAAFGLLKDIVTERNMNEIIMHGTNTLLYTTLLIK